MLTAERIGPMLEELRQQNIEFFGDRFKINGKVIPREEMRNYNSEVLNILKQEQKDKYLDEFPQRTDWEAALALPVECYHGRFRREGSPISLLEAKMLVHEMNPSFTASNINTTIKAAAEIHSIKTLPPHNWLERHSHIKSVDNGFRGNDEFYSLLNYYMDDARQDYILFIMSEGGQGKSTATNFLKYYFESEYYSADAKSINRFSAVSWASSRLVCFSDCSNDFIENSHILKQITGGDDIQLEGKGVQAYSGKIDSHLLFIGNEALSYDVLDTGMLRRFINLPWSDVEKSQKDIKWVDHEWTPAEIKWQLEYARDGYIVFDFDLKKLQHETIKESLARKSAFKYDSYEVYIDSEKRPYSRENFRKYWALVNKYFTQDEYDKRRTALSKEYVDVFYEGIKPKAQIYYINAVKE